MPLATNPKKTLPVWLKGDADVPESERPAFLCRYLTQHEIDDTLDELESIPGGSIKDATARLTAVLGRGITGWRNMAAPDPKTGEARPIEFDREAFPRVLTPDEMWELAYAMVRAPRLSEDEAKKSTSSPTSTPDSSAPGVPEGSAAKTS